MSTAMCACILNKCLNGVTNFCLYSTLVFVVVVTAVTAHAPPPAIIVAVCLPNVCPAAQTALSRQCLLQLLVLLSFGSN